jgi:hypothetical protein
MKKLLLVVVGLSFLAAACNKSEVTPNPTPTPNPAPVTESQVYENSYLKLNVLSSWTVKPVKSNPRAVNITKGNYILYINTNASQASGVEGGRFAEIAMGSPSADAVVTIQPSPPCGTSEKIPAFDVYSRVDLYVSGKDKKDYCSVPKDTSIVWYFSYLTDDKGYFIYDWNTDPSKLVITMSYNSSDINQLPKKGDAELNVALSEMTEIVRSLIIKP